MKRIGIAASKMAQGKLFLYNLYVILISFLFSFFIFLLSGATILLGLILLGALVDGILPGEPGGTWGEMLRVCMITLTALIIMLNFYTVLINIKFHKDS